MENGLARAERPETAFNWVTTSADCCLSSRERRPDRVLNQDSSFGEFIRRFSLPEGDYVTNSSFSVGKWKSYLQADPNTATNIDKINVSHSKLPGDITPACLPGFGGSGRFRAGVQRTVQLVPQYPG